MSVFRSVPIGAVCLLYAAMLSAAPVSHPSPPVVPLPTSLASSPLQEADGGTSLTSSSWHP